MNGQRKAVQSFCKGVCLLILMAGMVTPTPQQARAQSKIFTNASEGFAYQWDYSDRAVSKQRVLRSWLWGPAPLGPARRERMVGSPAMVRTSQSDTAPSDERLVQYYDKARMEFSPNPDGKTGIVTNGRLVVEMMSGSIQTSLPPGNEYFPLLPSSLPIAGDTAVGKANLDTPTYASLFSIANIGGSGPRATPLPVGTRVRSKYTRLGTIGTLPTDVASTFTPTVGTFYPPADPDGHNIPDIFWGFLTQRGIVSNGPDKPDQYRTDYLFENNNWVAAMGLPITEPYWAQVRVSGRDYWVLFQAFERRILTYTPSTEDATWRVEMGNVGQHYKDWRPNDLVPSPLQGVQVVQSSIQANAEVCLGNMSRASLNAEPPCLSNEFVMLPRSYITKLQTEDSWARTRANGWMLLHSDNAIYDMQSEAMLVFKGIDNSVDSVLQDGGQVDYLHAPKRRIEIVTGAGEVVKTYGTLFSIILPNPAQAGAGGEQLRIVVPSQGGSVTLQPPSPGGGEQAPAPIAVQSGQVLTAIKGQAVSYSTRPTTPAEEQYWVDKLNRLRGIPEVEELARLSEVPDDSTPTTFGDPEFERLWNYSEKPVVDGTVARIWLWGPAPLGPARPERMVGSPARDATPADFHLVQYFDKGRMQFNAKEGTVTYGRLVLEMMSGSIQISLAGDEYFPYQPNSLPIAGDTAGGAAHPDTPTYASLFSIANIVGNGARATPRPVGTTITATYARSGTVGTLPANAVPGALIPTVGTFYSPGDLDGHNIPNVFVDLLAQKGLVWSGPTDQYRTDYLFENNNWVAAVGRPITEPYWTQVRTSGKDSWVMFQAFERRILTYNPAADPLWRVEMGNVGQHYMDWRPEPLEKTTLGD